MHRVSTSRRSATTRSNAVESTVTVMATVATAEASATATVQADRYSLRTSVWREYFSHHSLSMTVLIMEKFMNSSNGIVLKTYRFENEGFFASTVTRKTPLGGNCVAVRKSPESIDVRDTKDPNSPTLSFTPSEWTAFIQGVKAGEFDL